MRVSSFVFFIIFFACLAGTASAQPAELKFAHIGSEKGLPQNTIHGIAKDKYGFMWFGTWGGLCRFDGYSFKIYSYEPSNNRSLNSNRIHNIIKDSVDNLWISTFIDNEICRYNYDKDDFERIPKEKVPVSLRNKINRRKHLGSINVFHKQYRWYLDAKENTLVRRYLDSEQKKTYRYDPTNPWSLNDSYVTDIYKDDHHIFWVGTYSSGINKANLNAKPFEHFYHDPLNSKSIIDNKVTAICEDKAGNIWVGTRDKGITVISNGTYRHITSKDGANTIQSDQIRKLFCDSRGTIWIGTKTGLDSYNASTNTFRSFTEEGLKYTYVFGITEDKDNNIWIASWKGIYKYSPFTEKLVHYNPETTLKSRFAKVILQDSRKQIWAGTEGGGVSVLRVLPNQDSLAVVKHILPDSASTGVISDNRINSIYEDEQGFIWIGTGKGLVRYDQKNEKYRYFPVQSGLADAIVAGILEDDNGYLWVSHKKGISQVDKKTFAVRNFTLQDGLQSNEFAEGAAYKSRLHNRLYFGGSKGFNVFNPDDVLPEKTVPATVLTELEILNQRVAINQEINGRVILTRPLYLTEEIELTYADKSVAIQFAGLHYANPEGNKYAYKLEGFDKGWVYMDADRRIASYSNLAPGDYTFKVISSNSDGIWNKEPATLKITVRPPFWASTWAYVVYGIIFLGLFSLYHYYSLRYSRLKEKLSYELLIKEKENELHQSKLQFFTNISHEIKTPLTLILAPVEKLIRLFSKNQVVVSELTTMQTNGDRLLKLINQLLDFRRLETGKLELNLQRDNVVPFLRSTLKSFEPLAETKIIKLEFVSSVETLRFPFDQDKLEIVISNLLSNAFKFTPAQGWIRLALSLKEAESGNIAVIEVANTGQVIPITEFENIFKPFQQGAGHHAEGTGVGLTFSKGLIELHGGTIEVKSEPKSASFGETSFRIALPLGNAEVFQNETTPEVQDAVATGTEHPVADVVPFEQQEEDLKHQERQVLINGKVPVILVVEDNRNLRQYLCDYFGHQYQVLEAEHGVEGFSIASQELPDLIISDVMMPEMNGFEFCRKIKSDAKTAHIPVVLLTARTQEEDEIEGIETGADDYVTKPFNLALLTARVKNLLITRNNLKEKYRRRILLEATTQDIPLSADEMLLKKVMQFVEAKLSDPELSVDDICLEVGVSRTQLYRKVKAVTGLGIAEIIREIRLKRAQQLLMEQKFSTHEVAYLAGFSDSDHFRKCFKAEYSITPNEYYKQLQEQVVINVEP